MVRDRRAIRTGDIATDLLRPLNFLGYWRAHDAGRAVFQAVARGIPPFLIAGLEFDLRLPTSLATWPLFVVSVALAVAVSFAIRAMVNLFALWFLDSRGLSGIVSTAWIFLGGLALPLATFPAWLRAFSRLTPFAATFDAPSQIFLEQLSAAGVAATLGLQVAWVILLSAAADLVMARGTRKLVIQGG